MTAPQTDSVGLYPLQFAPLVKETIWGGRKLAELFGKALPPDVAVGETWEVYTDNRVSTGPLAGRTLADLVAAYDAALLGHRVAARYGKDFPLLFKFLDAHQSLSVQVHPDDAQAQADEGVAFGKAEMWYVLHAEPGAQIVHGVAPGTTRAHLRTAAEGGRAFHDTLAHVAVQPGDVINIPAGTVHALGAGIVVYEVQQSCDVTYRLYDWDRRDAKTGQPRPLHVEKAAKVAALDPAHIHRSHPHIHAGRNALVAAPHFRVELLDLAAPLSIAAADTFGVLTAITAPVTITAVTGTLTLPKGGSILLPAALGAYSLAADTAQAILTTMP